MAAQPAPKTLLVAAASDLAVVQQPLAEALRRNSGYLLQFTYGSSGMLASQIAQGAPYDVFLSADQARVETLARGGHLLADSVAVYAVGRLALWSRGGKVRSLEETAGPGIRHVAMANPAHAPYGVAAKEALERSGLWPKLAGRIVYGETVRQALELATSGNADVAVVAWSLVIDRQGILLPERLHQPIRQSGGVVRGSRQADGGRQLLRYLKSREGQSLLERYGFRRVGATE
ncbi:MAG: molybdate ABC transporter substrate-binding protein [Acidobacteria bacterium]|nr:molybdate ABC transporter substrate-binding protein [Acidobacteriota bacterium]